MARPTHFEIPVEEADRAEKFYSELFGWTFQRYEDAPSYYGMTTTGPDSDTPGINGALFQMNEACFQTNEACSWMNGSRPSWARRRRCASSASTQRLRRLPRRRIWSA